MFNVLCSVVILAFAGASEATDETAIRDLLASRLTAWQKGDVQALVKQYTENGEQVSSAGVRSKGHAEIEKTYRALIDSSQLKGAKATQEVIAVNLVKPDVAIVEAKWALSGLKDADGNPAPDRSGRSLVVLVKVDGKWAIASLRADLLPGQ